MFKFNVIFVGLLISTSCFAQNANHGHYVDYGPSTVPCQKFSGIAGTSDSGNEAWLKDSQGIEYIITDSHGGSGRAYFKGYEIRAGDKIEVNAVIGEPIGTTLPHVLDMNCSH
jgi:hypothetical protein